MRQPTKPFALCVDNAEYKASLILGKVYRIIPDPEAAKDDLVRPVPHLNLVVRELTDRAAHRDGGESP